MYRAVEGWERHTPMVLGLLYCCAQVCRTLAWEIFPWCIFIFIRVSSQVSIEVKNYEIQQEMAGAKKKEQ